MTREIEQHRVPGLVQFCITQIPFEHFADFCSENRSTNAPGFEILKQLLVRMPRIDRIKRIKGIRKLLKCPRTKRIIKVQQHASQIKNHSIYFLLKSHVLGLSLQIYNFALQSFFHYEK